ncbi:MAG: hypothetical protein RMM31_06945 [Anaerolineae bacterium]|nr:hypothetical protein [Anaerolineae bacterium]
MAQALLLSKTVEGLGEIQATLQFDDAAFGMSATPTPWTISINDGGRDLGRIVGFEGDAATIAAMHNLKPDPSAERIVDMTVFRVHALLRERGLDAQAFAAFERWLLRRGWRGNIVKKLKFTDPAWVIPIREFWVKKLGFELILEVQGQWDEHVVKRWR